MFRPFTGQYPAALKSSNGILGSFELFRKLYAMEEYSEVAEMCRRILAHTYGGQLEVFLPPGRALLENSLIEWNGDATNEETKVRSKKAVYRTSTKINLTAHRVLKCMKFLCRLWKQLW